MAPAKAAGFQPGDRIVSFNGNRITDWSQVQREIRANGDKQATVVVERDGKRADAATRRPSSPR